ncbi:hypothetical protein AVEN_131349-1 [Araneus ventricosus]|uniref:Uncharacterized protein n=1 Tax=Araneus ventricosus TaxID=182803 RepID=A0A4Y2DJE2_ARAVE|nr:hypothetical protein AVEN_235817-1 [Araneus ventricosus]GBM15338.1 hypothetical protein AVEN_111781-1 [Araneus ventricosus]GBM15660.1 hypothetical protein AVEN_223404-1 [Araneus ventricosus]GBM15695.1 hypothetical protein AVEN_131349-1 [Araneus ventricosus]
MWARSIPRRNSTKITYECGRGVSRDETPRRSPTNVGEEYPETKLHEDHLRMWARSIVNKTSSHCCGMEIWRIRCQLIHQIVV